MIVGVNSAAGDTGEACVTARDCRLTYGITIRVELLKILEYWQTNILNNTQWRSDNIASMEGKPRWRVRQCGENNNDNSSRLNLEGR